MLIIEMPEEDREILMFLPSVMRWIERGEGITDHDFRHLIEIVPEKYEFAVNTSLEKIIEFNVKYQDDPEYGGMVRHILSEKGQAWLSRNLQFIKDYAARQNQAD